MRDSALPREGPQKILGIKVNKLHCVHLAVVRDKGSQNMYVVGHADSFQTKSVAVTHRVTQLSTVHRRGLSRDMWCWGGRSV